MLNATRVQADSYPIVSLIFFNFEIGPDDVLGTESIRAQCDSCPSRCVPNCIIDFFNFEIRFVYQIMYMYQMVRVVGKRDYYLCQNKDADQLFSYCTADQHFCFRYSDSAIPLLVKSGNSSFYPTSMTAQTGLCQTWSETPKIGFLASRLKWSSI